MQKDILEILIVEDDEIDYLAVKRHLNWSTRHEFRLTRAASADAAMEAIAATRFDCALVDYQLNGATGIDLLTRLGGREAPFPVIILTGHSTGPVADLAQAEGAFDFLEKTALTQQLLQRTIFYAMETHKGYASLRSALENAEAGIAVTGHMLKIVDGALLPRFEALLGLIAEETGARSAVTREAEGVFTLLQNLIDFRRLQEGTIDLDFYDTDAVAVLHRCTGRLKDQGIVAVSLDISSSLQEAEGLAGDEARFEQMTSNLLAWLVRESGSREISVSAGFDGAQLDLCFCLPTVAKGAALAEQWWEAGKPNTGAGDPAARLDLVVARELADRMGGTLDMAPDEAGLTVRLCLPLETGNMRRFAAVRAVLTG